MREMKLNQTYRSKRVGATVKQVAHWRDIRPILTRLFWPTLWPGRIIWFTAVHFCRRKSINFCWAHRVKRQGGSYYDCLLWWARRRKLFRRNVSGWRHLWALICMKMDRPTIDAHRKYFKEGSQPQLSCRIICSTCISQWKNSKYFN
jgi:hypothetical protein